MSTEDDNNAWVHNTLNKQVHTLNAIPSSASANSPAQKKWLGTFYFYSHRFLTKNLRNSEWESINWNGKRRRLRRPGGSNLYKKPAHRQSVNSFPSRLICYDQRRKSSATFTPATCGYHTTILRNLVEWRQDIG